MKRLKQRHFSVNILTSYLIKVKNGIRGNFQQNGQNTESCRPETPQFSVQLSENFKVSVVPRLKLKGPPAHG